MTYQECMLKLTQLFRCKFHFFHTDVSVSFTEDDFRANEPISGGSATFLPIKVSKDVKIASRLELVVTPLTHQQAIDTSVPLPPNIPAHNIHSPPFAGK